uniref:O-antigen ligase family protein n=1 Tax=Ignavibacterium album TaxID=591197 RepID=A0A832DGK9_9BACT
MVKIPKADLLAKISFLLLIFFTFFPTGIPFQEKMQERGVDEISSSNIINQILYLTIFVLAFLSAIPIRNKIFSVIIKEKWLSIFLLWAGMTIFWSSFPDVSFKRYFQVLTFYLTIISFLIYFPSITSLIKLIKPIIYSYILLTILVVISIPDAKDPAFGTWRGLTSHKNSLGQIGVILTIFNLIFFTSEENLNKKVISFIFFLFSIIITVGAVSSTSITSLFILLTISSIFYVKKKIFEPIGLSYFLSFFLIITGLISIVLLFTFIPNLTDYIEGIFGKDDAFYDRGKLWKFMLWEISGHPLWGCGFQGFWVIESPKIQMLYRTFIWLPIQAHNGYLDIINEIGIIGLLLFLVVIINYLVISYKKGRIELWVWFLINPLIISLTESTLFRPGHKSTVFLILSYLLLHLGKNKEEII